MIAPPGDQAADDWKRERAAGPSPHPAQHGSVIRIRPNILERRRRIARSRFQGDAPDHDHGPPSHARANVAGALAPLGGLRYSHAPYVLRGVITIDRVVAPTAGG